MRIAVLKGFPLIRPCGATFPPRGKALGESLLRQQMCLLQGGAQGDVQDNGADGGEQGVDQRHTAGDLGHDGDELRGLAKDVQVAEVADERVGEHVDQQAAEGRRRDGGHVLELVAGREGPEVDDLVGHRAADQTDDEFQNKGRDGVARVTGDNVGQRQADGTGQTAGHTVQQHGGQRRKGVAQMEAGPRAKDVRDAEELIRDKAQRGHDADDADFLHSEFRFGQRCDQQCQGCYDEQQQPHRCGRHSFVHLY